MEGVANNSGSHANQSDGVANNSLCARVRFPNQPSLVKGSTECNSLTYWWGATLRPPELSLAESVALAMRIAAMKEIQMNIEAEKPTLQMVLEFNGDPMDPAVEAIPHANAMVFNSTYE